MKNKLILLTLVIIGSIALALINKPENLTKNFIRGTPEIKSINALAFGPEGILFIGDSKSAVVFAIDTRDSEMVENVEAVEMSNVDDQIASALGTSADNIVIQDMAVNPLSKAIYFAVQHIDGTPVLLRLKGGTFTAVDMDDIKYSSISLNNPVAEDTKDRRGRSMRVWAVSDMGYFEGKVLVSGLSNQEFGSTFRSIPFPFGDGQDQSSLEIYHAAHGQYETHAPIKTFTTARLNNEPYLIASYTCTPLVLFPLSELKSGEHVKGRTVAELGLGNTPLDMISMQKNGDSYLIMSNSNRAVMKINYKDIESFKESLTNPVEQFSATEGVEYISFPMVNVVQMDKLDDNQFVLLQRKSNGNLDLRTAGSRWL